MDREERKQARFEKFFGDIVSKERREKVNNAPEDEYLSMYIEQPLHRRTKDIYGKILSIVL